MRQTLAVLLFSIGVLMVPACQQKPGGAADTARNERFSDVPDSSILGVFANTDAGIKELVIYGEQIGMNTFQIPDVSQAPTVGKVSAFFLNMPDTKVMNSKIFWLSALPAPHQTLDQQSYPALPVQIEAVKGSMYKVLSPELANKQRGVLLFKVGMPLGTADRLYAIKLAP